jgi:hypothetical protein
VCTTAFEMPISNLIEVEIFQVDDVILVLVLVLFLFLVSVLFACRVNSTIRA